MCGRYWLKDNPEELARRYGARLFSSETEGNGEVFPSYFVPVVTAGGNDGSDDRNLISNMIWGFPLPGKKGAVINARSETVAFKSIFKKRFMSQRCIVPANGFFEWKEENDEKNKKRKIKHIFNLPDETVFSLAGIFGDFHDEANNSYRAFVIITVEPNNIVAPIHNRMPVILPEEKENIWLNTNEQDSHELTELMVPYNSDRVPLFVRAV